MTGDSLQLNDRIVDSGAGHHMTNDRSDVKNSSDSSLVVATGGGERHEASEVGESRVIPKNGRPFILAEAHVIPSLKYKFLSVSQMDKKGCSVIFQDGKVHIFNQQQGGFRGELIADGVEKAGVYVLNELTSSKVEDAPEEDHALATASLGTWHKRLHVHKDAIRRTEKAVNGMKIGDNRTVRSKDSTCVPCILGKAKVAPRREQEKILPSTGNFQRIYMDLITIDQTREYRGKPYALVIMDDHSGLVTLYPMKFKSQAVDCIKNHLKWVKNQFGGDVKRFRIDRGGEFDNDELKRFAADQGIDPEFIPTADHDANARTENLAMKLQETMRSLLHQAGAPVEFATNALGHSVWIWNRTTHNDEEVTPFEKAFNQKPDLHCARVWGCAAYGLTTETTRHKATPPRSKPYVFIGVEGNAAILYNRDTRRISHPRLDNCTFIEDEFPWKETKKDEADDQRTSSAAVPVPVPMAEVVRVMSPAGPPEVKQAADSGSVQAEQVQDVSAEVADELENGGDSGNDGSDRPERRSTRPRAPPTEYWKVPVHGNSGTADAAVDVKQLDESYLFSTEFVERFAPSPGRSVTMAEAMASEEKDQWNNAIKSELDAWKEHEVYEVVSKLPSGKKALATKWVLAVKDDGRFKARLVVRGDLQQDSDFDETYASMARKETFRLQLALAVRHGMKIVVGDVKNAYLNTRKLGKGEEIYLKIPKEMRSYLGLPAVSDHVLLLKKAVYGTRQGAYE